MPVTYLSPSSTAPNQLRRPYFPGHRSSYLELIPEEELEAFARMEEIGDSNTGAAKEKSASSPEVDQLAAAKNQGRSPPSDLRMQDSNDMTPMDDGAYGNDYLSAGSSSYSRSGFNTPSSPDLTRSSSSGSGSGFDTSDSFPPVDRLTMFDILENLALPQRLENIQNAIHDNAEKLRKQRAKLASRALSGKNNLVGEWRKRVPRGGPDERLGEYSRRMRDSVDRLNKRWSDAKQVKLNEKISFVSATLNIFISAYLIGGWPQYFHYWYTVQLAYVYPPSHIQPEGSTNHNGQCSGTSCPSAGTNTTKSATITSSPTSATTSTSSSSSASGSFPNPNASSSALTVSLSGTMQLPLPCGGTVWCFIPWIK